MRHFGDTPLTRLTGLGVRADRMVNVLGLVGYPLSAPSGAGCSRTPDFVP